MPPAPALASRVSFLSDITLIRDRIDDIQWCWKSSRV
jgi:hypothetical protein